VPSGSYPVRSTHVASVYLIRNGMLSMRSPIRQNAFYMSDSENLQPSPTLCGRASQAAADSNRPQRQSGMQEGTGCASRPMGLYASGMQYSAGMQDSSSRVTDMQPVLEPLGCVQARTGRAGLLPSHDDIGQSSKQGDRES
jgi:hypothetical protein